MWSNCLLDLGTDFLLRVQQCETSVQGGFSSPRGKGDHASTQARSATAKRWKNSFKLWKMPCLAYSVQTSARDGNTSRILSIKLPCLHSARDKSVDWFKAYSKEMLPVIEEKRCALAMYKSSPSVKSLQALRTSGSKVQQTALCQ